jgi:LysM repeat protein
MPDDTTEANEKVPGGKKKKNANLKWYLVGGIGIIAVLVLFFVNRSKANAGTAATTTPNGTTGLDANTLAALSQAGLLGGASLGSGGGGGLTGPTGATGPAGPTGGTTKSGGSNPPPSPPPISKPTKTYTVKPGQTLAQIANMFGISVATLAHANVYVAGEVAGNKKVGQPLGTGAGLKTGQVLKIPNAK